MVIAVDFDGTIVEHAYPNIGAQIGKSIEILRYFKENLGCKVILWTCREPAAGLEEAVEYCCSRGLEFDAVNENVLEMGFLAAHKICADLYIDDRCGGRLMAGKTSNMSPDEWHLIKEQVEAYVQASIRAKFS